MGTKIKPPRAYIASDYAGLSCENARFYYGYESVDDETGDWCFTADIKGREQIKIPFRKLGANDPSECYDCLLIGIGWVLTRYSIDV